MRQGEIFLQEEGNRWFQRTIGSYAGLEELIRGDRVLHALAQLDLKPERTLEIGCSNGWRLAEIHKAVGGGCHGLEPSLAAIEDGRKRFPAVDFRQGTADNLPYEDSFADLVICGFFLYVSDRRDLFRIAAEVDRVLADGGSLVILDFVTPAPMRNEYKHREGISSFKMDYPRMFTWNPAYFSYYRNVFAHQGTRFVDDPNEWTMVEILRKNNSLAFPPNPYPPVSR